jgi:hypothetical protein
MDPTNRPVDISLPYVIYKQLLQDIEAEGQPRERINLLNICNRSGNVYGKPASDVRRAVQKKFAKLKAKPFKHYMNTLDKYSINPGSATERLLRESAAEDSGPLADDEDQQLDELTIALSTRLSIIEQETESMASPLPPSVMFTPPPSFASPNMTQETTTFASSMKKSAFESIAASGLQQIGDGTKEHPYIICVDVKHPERNREFSIERVSNIAHNSYTRNGFHIRVPIAPPDFDKWEAFIPNQYPALQNRVVQVKGPSQSFWIRSTDRYHKKFNCDATEQAHAATELEIAADQSRQLSYWLLVFPENITLDNQIFSDDNVNLEPGYNAMSTEANETDINKKLYGMAVYWKIAEIGGRKFQVGKPKPNARRLFD